MPPFLYPLPTTSLLTFSNIFHDPRSAYTSHLAEATAARTRLVLALKAYSSNEPGSSALAVLDAVQVYLPHLRGIINCLEADELLYKGDPVFQWRSPLTHYTSSSPLLSLPTIHSEHVFVILTLILSTSNYAHSILASLPVFEPPANQSSSSSSSKSSRSTSSNSFHMSAEDEKKTTTGLARAVDLLCQAAGIAEWAGENVLPVLDGVRGGSAAKGKWPVDTGIEAFRGLAMMLLADAHVTAIRKLLLPVLPHTLFSPPGPPLPSLHPSPSLLSKLYLHVSTLYTSSLAQFEIHRPSSSSFATSSKPSASRKLFSKDKSISPSSEGPIEPNLEGKIIPELSRYLRIESVLSSSLANKWLGIESGENSKAGDNVGVAISRVKEAKRGLEELEDGKMREKMKNLGIGKGNEKRKEERARRKGRIERELEDLGAWLASYQKLNDTVAFQPIPPVSSLTNPSGRPIFSSKPFKPPPIKFGPDFSTRPGSGGGNGEVEGDVSYAGKGNYY